MKKTLVKGMLLATILALPVMTAEARFTQEGMSGVINTPTAEVAGMAHFGVMVQGDEDKTEYGGNVTVIPGLEVAYAHWARKDMKDLDILSAKAQLVAESTAIPALAVGISDATDELDRSVFVAATKKAFWGLTFNAGIGNDRYDNGFVSVQKTFSFDDDAMKVKLNLEWDGEDFNYAAGVPVGKVFEVEAGSRSQTFFVGANARF